MTNAEAIDLAGESAVWRLPSRLKVAVICLIVTESAMFTIFVVAYLYYIGKSLVGPYPKEVLDIPVFSTICLLSSSLTIVLAERAFHRHSASGFRLWWAITIVLGAIFLVATALEWKHLIVNEHLTISTNVFGTTFYSLVGLHASHVIVGLTLLLLVLTLSLRGKVRKADGERLQMVSWYWHFVDAVWVVVFTVVYIIGR